MEIDCLKNSVIDIRSDITNINEFVIVKEKNWNNGILNISIQNISDKSIKTNEIALLSFENTFPSSTLIYGEGYNMLSQYEGTSDNLNNFGYYDEHSFYNLPTQKGFFTVYNLALFSPKNEDCFLIGFSSCNRFSGEIRINKKRIEIVQNTEGIEILPNEIIELEEVFMISGEKNSILDSFANQINVNHPIRKTKETPTGWCSWLVYGPEITSQKIFDNLEVIKKNKLPLKFIQIDDGYQKAMGDWLIETDKFKGGIKELCLNIKKEGFEPAIWVAPFIAEQDSNLFKMHPDWFIYDCNKKPLPSDKVSFGGWRCGPWYMLDGTNPEAQNYLKNIFQTMNKEWGVSYFKLDANMWGALPFGNHYLQNKTAVEAYRLGMKAVIEGAGENSFILGCNAPMWPSLGLVNGMRLIIDNDRLWSRFKKIAKELFHRNWQNKKLWINDPDTVLLGNNCSDIIAVDGSFNQNNELVSKQEYMFNAAYTLASGGLMLSSDNLTTLSKEMIKILKKLVPPQIKSCIFTDNSFTKGYIDNLLFLFNYENKEKKYEIKIQTESTLIDFWTDEIILKTDKNTDLILPQRSAKVIRIINK